MQFWWGVKRHRFNESQTTGLYTPNGSHYIEDATIDRWTEIGWSKIGKEWRLARRDRYLARASGIDELETIDDGSHNHSALVDAPRMIKAQAAPLLMQFVMDLLIHVLELNREIRRATRAALGEEGS